MDPEELLQKLAAAVAKRPSPAATLGVPNVAAWGRAQLQEGLDKLQAVQGELAARQAEMEAAAKAAAEARPPAPPPVPATVAPPPVMAEEPLADGPLQLVDAETAEAVCRRYALEPAALPLLQPHQSPRAFLDALLAAGLQREALRFLAYGLPRPLAVLWGGLCCDTVTPAVKLPPAEFTALAAAFRCIMKPSEELRRAAEGPARAAGAHTPAGCLALAIFSGAASLADPSLPPVPPPPYLANQLVHAANCIALGQADPSQIGAVLRQFLDLGVWIGVHGPLAARHRESCADVRQHVRNLFRDLNLLPANVPTRDDTTQEIWEYLERERAAKSQ